jgi:hypothetical protein
MARLPKGLSAEDVSVATASARSYPRSCSQVPTTATCVTSCSRPQGPAKHLSIASPQDGQRLMVRASRTHRTRGFGAGAPVGGPRPPRSDKLQSSGEIIIHTRGKRKNKK